MGRIQTWGEAGNVRGLPGPEEQHLHPGLQWGREGRSVAPISRRGHTSLSPAKGRHACRHPHSSGLERGLWAPEAPGVPALLSSKGPARARQPGRHHLDSPGLPCDPTSLRPGDPNTRQLHKEKPTVVPALGHAGSPWPVYGQGSPGTHRTGHCTHRPGGLLGQGHPTCPLGMELHSSSAWMTAMSLPMSLLGHLLVPSGSFPLGRSCCVSCGFASSRASSSCDPLLS